MESDDDRGLEACPWVREPYEASSLGQVRSLDREVEQVALGGTIARRIYRGRILKPATHGRYHQVTLSQGGVTKTLNVHALICETFHGPRPSPQHEAAHWNGDVADNSMLNLRCATKAENADDKKRHGTLMRGEGHANYHLSDAQVIEIYNRYSSLTSGKTSRAPSGSIKALAEEYGITTMYLENVIYDRSRRHLFGGEDA